MKTTRKRSKVTVTSNRTVRANFGEHRPTFAEVAEIAHRHGLSDYVLEVRNVAYESAFSPLIEGYKPEYVARFERKNKLA